MDFYTARLIHDDCLETLQVLAERTRFLDQMVDAYEDGVLISQFTKEQAVAALECLEAFHRVFPPKADLYDY